MKKSIIRDFNRAAKNYDAHAKLQRIVADKLFSLIKSEITNNHIVLDGGCGTGYFHELLRKNKIYCPLIQSDIAFNMSLKAAEYASPPEYGGTYTITSDLELLPISNRAIDIFYSSLTLQWVNDTQSVLAEIYRVLKPEGTIAFSTVGNGSLMELAESFAELGNKPRINHNLDKNQIANFLTKSGFSQFYIKSETITEYFESALDVMRSIKGVGANYKLARAYPGKDYFLNLEQVYRDKFGHDNGLPLSWNIIYVVAQK